MAKKVTYAKQAEQEICSISLKDLGLCPPDVSFVSELSEVSSQTYMDLVLFSPSRQSHLGTKFSSKIEKHIDELVNMVLTDLDIRHVYFYESYESSKSKSDISGSIKEDSDTFLVLCCGSGFLEALYSSIRNALAHGNIIRSKEHYYLYSVSSKGGEKTPEDEKNISFLLKTSAIKNLDVYTRAFSKFN